MDATKKVEDVKPSNLADELNNPANLIAEIKKAGYKLVPLDEKSSKVDVNKVTRPTIDLDLSGDGDLSLDSARKLVDYVKNHTAYVEGLFSNEKVEIEGKLAQSKQETIMEKVTSLYKKAVSAGVTDEDFRNKIYPEMVNLHREGQDLEDTFTKACKLLDIKNPFTSKEKETKVIETKVLEKKIDSEEETSGLKSNLGAPSSRTLNINTEGKSLRDITTAAVEKALADTKTKIESDED